MKDISRSEQKRRFKQVELAARELAELSDSELRRLPGSEQLREEIALCRNIKGGALKRQVKYVAKIMREEPLDEILGFLKELKGSKLQENRFQHDLEKLRDAVVNEALTAYEACLEREDVWTNDWQSETLEHLAHSFPDIDEKELRRSAHQYARSRNKTHYRELFRLIRAAAEKKRLSERRSSDQ